jgi:hypothetical protein
VVQNEYDGLAFAVIVLISLTVIYYGFNFIVDVVLVIK